MLKPDTPSTHQRHILRLTTMWQAINSKIKCLHHRKIRRCRWPGKGIGDATNLPYPTPGYAGLDDVVRQSKIELDPGRYYRDHCYREQYQ